MNIVFVCTGNTCRSPMAEAIFRDKTKDFAEYLNISSCGLGAMPGDPASENAVSVMAERNIDISSHRSRQINRYIVDEADYIICLSDSHYKYLLPIAGDKVVLLGQGITDPFMGSMDIYRECADRIENAIDNMLSSDLFIDICKMTENDIEAAAVIEKQCFSDPWSEASFISQIQKEYSVSYAAHYLGKTVGYICCDDICNEVYVGTVAVAENMRQRNIGTKLINAVVDYCKKNASDLLTLEVRVSNTPAINLYTSLGFENLGKRKGFYSRPTEDAYIMTKYFNGDINENTCN